MQTQSATSIQSTKAISDILESDSAEQNEEYTDYSYSQFKALEEQLSFREPNSPENSSSINQTEANNSSNLIRDILRSVGTAIGNGVEAVGNTVSKAKDWFVSQIKGRANPKEDSSVYNGNCGPTSLLMVARMFGKVGGGAEEADAQIEQMRTLMGAGPDENDWTNTSQLATGAQKLGLSARNIQGGVNEVEGALARGEKVIVNVNPAKYGGADTRHFAVVTDIEGDKVTLYDPAKQQPITITRAQLGAAMADVGGNMVAIGNRQENIA